MSDEVADLYAAFGLQTDTSSFSKGGAALDGIERKATAFQDKQGRWRAANGKFMTDAEKQAAGLGNAIKGAGDKVDGVADKMGSVWHLALMAAAVVGIEHAEHALIGFNQEVQDAKIQLSAMISGMTGTEWGKATGQADALYNEFQRFSTVTPVTTQQILEFGKGIAAATFAAGGSVEQLKNLTEQGVIASKVLAGDRGAGYAQLEITELLSGTINKRMILARQLLSMGHISEEAWKALDGKGRIRELQKIFNSDAMNHARDALGESFSGVTSTAWDLIQIALGKVGLPLFAAITAKVKELNQWMAANSATVENFAHRVGEDLVQAFDMAVAAFEFVSDHATFFEGVLIGLGALIAGFAVTSAIEWAIAFWPITLAIAAIATLHSAINWLFGDIDDEADKAASTMGGFSDAIGAAASGNFDDVNQSLKDVKTNADKASAAVQQLTDFWGNDVGPKGPPTGLEGIVHGVDTTRGPQVSLGTAHGEGAKPRGLPAPTLPSGAVDNAKNQWGQDDAAQLVAAMKSQEKAPQVNVVITGNMPEGWVDAKIDGKVNDYHETTWNNAANALQADDDE